MAKVVKTILKYNRIVLAIILLLNLISLFIVVTKFSVSSNILSFFRHGFKEASQFERINEKYGGTDVILIGLQMENIISKEHLKRIYKFQNDLKKIKGVGYINSFAPPKILKNMHLVEVSSNNIEKLYPDIIKFLKENNSSMYKKDAGTIFVQLNKGTNPNKVIKEIIEISKGYKDIKFHYFGSKIMEYFLNGYIIILILFVIPIVVILLFIIFKLSLRNNEAVALSLAPAGIAALWVFAYIFLLGNKLNLLTILTPLFVIVIGSAGALHVVSHYIENRRKMDNNEEAIMETMKMVGIPIVMTAVTTMAGFFSLEVSSIPEVRKMGYFTAIGIGFAALISWFFIPAVLKIVHIKIPKESPVFYRNVVNFFLKAYKRPKLVITILSIIVIIFALFIPGLHLYTDETLFFKGYTKVVRDANFFKKNFGFSSIAIIDYQTGKNGALSDKNTEKAILSLEKRLKEIDGVKDVVSYFDIAKKIENSIGNKVIAGMVLNIMIKEGVIPLNQWVYKNRDFKIILQLRSGDSKTILKIKEICDKHKNAIFTGPDYLFYILNSKVVHDQLNSLLLAIILVFSLMLIFYRKIEYAIKGIVPIIVTLIIFFGFLHISTFNINIVIATIASISIGVGIDYAIHFIGAFIYYKEDIEKTLRSVSIPILTNALGLSIGLSGLLLSPLRIHFYVSISMWVTMVVSSISALLILPILFKKTKKANRLL